MKLYKIRINGEDGKEIMTIKRSLQEEYEVGDRIHVPDLEEGSQVIYDKYGEQVAPTTFPKPVWGTVIKKECLKKE